MNRKTPLLIFFLLVGSSIISSIICYHSRETYINNDVQRALAMTMAEREYGVVDADTIRTYRNYISIPEIKDTASISVRTSDSGNGTILEANAGCGFLTILASSDQRTSGTFATLALLWAVGCLWYNRKYRLSVIPVNDGLSYGGLHYMEDEARFMTDKGEEVRLTPMQHQLMEMFFRSSSHTLSKQMICDALWPKKPDASDTLYTLIRRLKPIVEENSDLKIECDRGKSYTLINK